MPDKVQEFMLHPQLQADTYPLGDFPLCRLLLSRDSRYPWFVLVPRRESITEIVQLSASERQQLLEESCLLQEAMLAAFQPDKLNVAALGNMVSQLHLHHIARYRDDPAWPAPVWGKLPASAYSEQLLQQRLAQLQPHMPENFNWEKDSV